MTSLNSLVFRGEPPKAQHGANPSDNGRFCRALHILTSVVLIKRSLYNSKIFQSIFFLFDSPFHQQPTVFPWFFRKNEVRLWHERHARWISGGFQSSGMYSRAKEVLKMCVTSRFRSSSPSRRRAGKIPLFFWSKSLLLPQFRSFIFFPLLNLPALILRRS